MPSKRERKERMNVRNYFMDLAKHYEENGFLIAAAVIYKRFDKRRARQIYKILANQSQMNGLYELAAESYELCGQKGRAKRLRRYLGISCSRRGVLGISNNDKPDFLFSRFLFATTRLEREGMFEQAKKYWLNAARYCELVGEFRFAALYYFKCGYLAEAKRLWRRASAGMLILHN